MFRTLLALLTVCTTASGAIAGDARWSAEGRKCAIVLTYDDALRSQLEIAIPQLEAANLRGTFFLDGDLTPDDMRRWREVAMRGHELGNHSLFHPCPRAMLPERSNYWTEHYDAPRMLEEIAAMNNVLFGIDGRTARTYSVPCSQTLVGKVDYVDALRGSGLVRFARTGGDQWTSVVTDWRTLDLMRVPSHGPVNEPSGAELIAYVERVRAAGGLGVLQFHGVGGDYLKVSAQAHQQLVDHLRAHPDVWVATFQEVMDYVATRTR
jgi:peptidoglycan/xylan/chitin deacetylase (PgdA/CDA1 family)